MEEDSVIKSITLTDFCCILAWCSGALSPRFLQGWESGLCSLIRSSSLLWPFAFESYEVPKVMEVVRNLGITLRNWPSYLFPFLWVLWAFFILICLFVCLFSLGGVQMCLPTVIGNGSVRASLFVVLSSDCCITSAVSHSFPSPLQLFPTLSYTGFLQDAASLAEELSCVLNPTEVL